MFHSLALGGGGVRGGLHVGALRALEELRGNLQFSKGVYGCSVGSIVATAVAFNMTASQIREMFDTQFDLDKFIPPLRLSCFGELAERKGLFSMDLLEQTLIKAFASQNIDLRGKMIGDSPQTLYIVASNMTTQNATVFNKNVSILDAIKCSSCLPIIYSPQIVGGNVYMDGGVLMDSLVSIVSTDTLVLHISETSQPMSPSDLADLSIPMFLHRIYRNIRGKPVGPNVLCLYNATIGILHDITPADKETLCEEGYSQTLAFLTKRFPKELQ
jgi:predicted acylesterase/phospholipase RssA